MASLSDRTSQPAQERSGAACSGAGAAAGGAAGMEDGGRQRGPAASTLAPGRTEPGAAVRVRVRSAAVVLGRLSRALQSGAFINHMWGEAGTVLGYVQMFLIRLFMIWPLKAVAPSAFAYWSYQLFLRFRADPAAALHAQSLATAAAAPMTARGRLRATAAWAGRELLRSWLALEAIFYLYYRFQHFKLERRAANAPVMPPGKPMEALRKSLDTVEMIQKGGKLAEPHLSLSQSFPLLSSASPRISKKASEQELQAALNPQQSESGVEQLLRDWHDARSTAGSLDLVPTAVRDTERAALEQLVDDAEVLTLKRAEACGWFMEMPRRRTRWPTARIRELKRGNVAEWVAWAFFHCEVDRVPAARRPEMEALIDEIASWAEVQFAPGYCNDMRAMRLTMDPIPATHRPLLYYLVTQTVFTQIINYQVGAMGFEQHFSGTLLYWHRAADNSASVRGKNSKDPIVFCHGIGVNLLPYRPFIDAMLRQMPDRAFFLISLPHISMRIKDEVPSSAETVACISDMLASWGFSSAHFVGHSFGSLPMAWMARKAPRFVSAMTFMDPVCFLLVKPDVCYNFMYREPADPTQLLINYFLAKELYIAHSLSRNFFWHQNQLWPDELPGPTLVVLNGRDSIVPAHSVRRYLTAYKHRRKVDTLRVLWFPDMGHGEINFGPVGEAACAQIVREMIHLEADFPPTSPRQRSEEFPSPKRSPKRSPTTAADAPGSPLRASAMTASPKAAPAEAKR